MQLDRTDKETTTEIIKKIIKPYVFHLQKIIKSYQTYSALVRNDY